MSKLSDVGPYHRDGDQAVRVKDEFAHWLRADMPSCFKHTVRVQHEDGTAFIFNDASFWYNDHFLVVWTEHNDYHHFSTDDVRWEVLVPLRTVEKLKHAALKLPQLKREYAAARKRDAKDMERFKRKLAKKSKEAVILRNEKTGKAEVWQKGRKIGMQG